MRPSAVAVLLALLCVWSLGCKDGSSPTEDAGIDAALDNGAGGMAGGAGTAGTGGTTGIGGAGGAGGSNCEFTICPTGCVDLDTNDQNCGSCGKICEGTETCLQGICTPEPE